jgi:hypothetical protein
MSEINDLIVVKLRKHPPQVAEVAIEAIRLAEALPLRAMEEQLQSVLRRAVRKEGIAR